MTAPEKSLFQLSYPLLLNALVGMLVMLVDMKILSAYSDNAAAAVSIANQILLVAFDFSSLFAAGAVVMVSRQLGAGRADSARKTAVAALAANAMASLLLGLCLLPAAPYLAAAINCPSEIFSDATIYLRVGAFTILFNGIMMAATAVLRGHGETRLIFLLGIAAYATYLASEYLLVFGWGVIPELGVLGSGLATLLVRMSAAILLLVVLVRRLQMRDTFRKFQLRSSLARMRQLFDLSWPSTIDNFAYGFYQIILVSFIASQSVAMLLSRTFTLTLTAVLTVTLMAISQANEVMVGFRHGASRKQEINGCVIRSSLVSTLLTTSLAFVLYQLADPLVGLFTEQREILRLAKQLLWITIFVQPFRAVNTILFHSLRALGDVVVPVMGTQIMMWVLSVPLAYVLAVKMELGTVGLWYVLLLEEALKAIFLLIRWIQRQHKS